MRSELVDNASKGSWEDWRRNDPMSLLNEVNYHAAKLGRAILEGNLPLVEELSADVANMAMMVRDACWFKAYMKP